MGSSKKNKDKDRKKKKRERSRSKERDREKHHRHHHKHKKHKRVREEKSPSISLSDLSLSDFEYPIEKNDSSSRRDTSQHFLPSPPAAPTISKSVRVPPSPTRSGITEDSRETGKKEILALSVEESNKIRAKLGLKPLTVGPAPLEEEDDSYKPGEEIHKPPENIRDKLQIEKLREKIALQREKRKQKEKLSKVRGLGDESDEESSSAWVLKSRKIEQEKKEAEKRNKLLEELDAQFGIGDLVEEEMTHRKKHLYDSKHLSGIKVQHDTERFSEEHSTILTLKDSNILDGEEDTLVNVNLIDQERVERNLKNKKRKLDEVEYDAPEVDDFGNIVQNTLLTKYDEEISGEKKKSFRIGSRGEAVQEASPPRLTSAGRMAKLRKLTNLDMPEAQLATEYLTPSEMVSFKKKKRKKKKMLTADDLEALPDLATDFGRGSRSRRRETEMETAEDGEVDGRPHLESHKSRTKNLRELLEEDEDESPTKMDVEEQREISESENDDIELQEALARSRRAKLAERKVKLPNDKITDMLSSAPKEDPDEGEDDLNMTLNITDEFCRTLGDIPTYGLSGNRADEESAMLLPSPPRAPEEMDIHGGAWEEVLIEDTKVEISNEKSVPILEEEPDTGKGVANALHLATKKGYLEKGNMKKAANATLQHLRALHYSIEDKAVEDERRGRGDRYMGPVMDFREKETYKPDVKLEYVDDEGRKLNAKEAFRYLSHKFHGKGSGKNKLEKRMKKWKEELLMKHMSSSDTPLQTLERQREKQRQLGSAYLVLSGSKTQETLEVKK